MTRKPARQIEFRKRNIQLLLLIVVFLSILFFQNPVSGFLDGHHGWLSSHGLALAKSISFDTDLLMYNEKIITDEGLEYVPYNRFPIFPFALLKVSMMPFKGDLTSQIYMARQLMNLFFIGSMIVAILIIRKLTQSNYQAISVVLMSFSSSYFLYYADMTFNDIPALFGFLLALFISLYWSDGTLKNKTLMILLVLLSISMGWQPLAVYLTWFLINIIHDLRNKRYKLLTQVKSIIRKPYFLSFIVGVFYSGVIFFLQIGNEWRVMGGDFLSLPTINSMGHRLNLGFSTIDVPLPNYFEFIRDSELLYLEKILEPFHLKAFKVTILLLLPLFIISAVKFDYKKYFKKIKIDKKFMALLLLVGFVWHLPLKNFVFIHDFQAIFFVGIPLLFYFSFSLLIPKNLHAIFAVAISILFMFNVYQIGLEKQESSTASSVVTVEFENINAQLPSNSKIFIDGNKHAMAIGHHAVDFYLSDHYFTSLEKADYIISREQPDGTIQLTKNHDINLYKVNK